jgi:hypothetical protein
MTDTRPHLTGGCACGAVRYAVDAPLGVAGYCHCTRCQRRTGAAASANARLQPGSLRWTAGEEHIRVWTPEDGGFAKGFCSRCGSALFSHAPDRPQETMALRLGTVDGDPGVRPSYRQRVATAAVWEPLPDDGLPRHEGPAVDHRTAP